MQSAGRRRLSGPYVMTAVGIPGLAFLKRAFESGSIPKQKT